MQYKPIAITPRDGFDLLAVWEKDGRKWHLLQLARPQSAIALARENPKVRLVFPTGVNPNRFEQKILSSSRKAKGSNYNVEQKDYPHCAKGASPIQINND